MKIGLITYHHSVNYGAVMQTYATCRVLRELGHKVEIIDLRQEEKWKFKYLIYALKYIQFARFRNKYYPTKTKFIKDFTTLKNKNFTYDCLLVGSDQVWNPEISKDNYLAYFLDFGPHNINRVSYASSFGISKWPKNRQQEYNNILNAIKRFKAVSVREKTGQEILRQNFNIESNIVIDPTLLHQDYNEITNHIKSNNKIICYLLNRTKEQIKASRHIGKLLNKKPSIITNAIPISGLEYIYPPSIENWIKYIGGANFIITDSFHGLAFSLLYNKEFIVFAVENGKNSRLLDLLTKVGLENRYFTRLEDLLNSNILNEKIDYNKVNSIINQEREKSIIFLKNAL